MLAGNRRGLEQQACVRGSGPAAWLREDAELGLSLTWSGQIQRLGGMRGWLWWGAWRICLPCLDLPPAAAGRSPQAGRVSVRVPQCGGCAQPGLGAPPRGAVAPCPFAVPPALVRGPRSPLPAGQPPFEGSARAPGGPGAGPRRGGGCAGRRHGLAEAVAGTGGPAARRTPGLLSPASYGPEPELFPSRCRLGRAGAGLWVRCPRLALAAADRGHFARRVSPTDVRPREPDRCPCPRPRSGLALGAGGAVRALCSPRGPGRGAGRVYVNRAVASLD